MKAGHIGWEVRGVRTAALLSMILALGRQCQSGAGVLSIGAKTWREGCMNANTCDHHESNRVRWRSTITINAHQPHRYRSPPRRSARCEEHCPNTIGIYITILVDTISPGGSLHLVCNLARVSLALRDSICLLNTSLPFSI